MQTIRLFISEWDDRCDWLQTTAEHDVVWSIWAGNHGELSCAYLKSADRRLFGLSTWLSTRSSTATWRTRSTAAWLPDNCTLLVDSLQQTVHASNIPTIVRKFTQRPSCTIPFWRIEILNQNLIFLWNFHDFVYFLQILRLDSFPW